MQKAVVTGGAGFIGSNLVDELIKQGKEVLIIDDLSTGKKENINPNAKFSKLDLDAYTSSIIAEEIKGYDVVFHMAALPQVQQSIKNPTNNVNINSTINILEASKKANIKRVIFSSTCALYGNPKYIPIDEKHPVNPLSPYALHKLIGEQYCKLYSNIYNLDTVCLRYFNVYGNRMVNKGAYRSVISIFKEQYINKESFNIVNDGEQRRDYVHVKDIVNANILCSNHLEKLNGTIFNVGTGDSYSVNQIADMFGGEKKYGEVRIEPQNSKANNKKINRILNWKSTNKLKTWISTFTEQSSTE